MENGFAAYVVRWEGSSSEVEETALHFVVTCDDDYSMSEAKSATNGKGLRTYIIFYKIRGGNIIKFTQKIMKFCSRLYCTSYSSNQIGQPGDCVFCA